tara:strand:- start:3061 stop:4740 length:1680 start_codon:yes stop_codon:yes gene_type:complete
MIALYPGAFKPPHRGHFNVVKSLLDGSYNGSIYDKDNYKEKGADLVSGESNEKPNINKVIVFVGAGERNGIDKDEALTIWNIYAKYLGNVEILDGGSNPMFAAKDYAQANPETKFVAVTGIRSEEDFVDLRRVTTFKNAPNVQGLALASKPGSGIRATDFRKNILSGNLDQITDFFPKDLSREEILKILNDLKDKIVAEILAKNIDGFINEYFNEGQLNKTGIINSVDKNRLDILYNYLYRLVPSGVNITHNRDYLTVKFDNLKEEKSNLKLKEYITSLTEYMLDIGMNISPLPEVIVKKDEVNAANFFGRTAYYSPSEKKIVLYITGRHNKDIVRSYAHEMVHHMQNLQGVLTNINTTDTNSDDRLLQLEKEAYTLGNITFRNWEDSIKNLDESLWANINAKKKSGKKSSHKNSKAYKAAKKAGTALKKSKNEVVFSIDELAEDLIKIIKEEPKKGTGKKPKGSSRRLYTDEDPKDTVGVKFSSRQDIVDTLNKKSFKAKSHARQSQIINLIHQRTRAAYNRAKKPDVKKRLKSAFDYIKDRKEASKKKTQRLKKSKK